MQNHDTQSIPFEVKFWGEYGCFTRPEHKSDRVSYDFMTPSAARGCLEAIFWKPEMRWIVQSIKVLNPIRRMSVVTNEVKSRQSYQTAINGDRTGHFYTVDNDHTPRHSLILKNPAYIVQAVIQLEEHCDKPILAYQEQFLKRLRRGQCFSQPFMGCRDFIAYFEKPSGREIPIGLTDDFGFMLYDIEFEENEDGPISYNKQTDRTGPQLVKGTAKPKFFNAQMVRGVVQCS